MACIENIKEFDYRIFSKINGDWHNEFFDVVFLLIREAAIWIPLYVFLLILVPLNYKKNGWIWVLYLSSCVIISNYISSNLIKDHIMRLRPCQDPFLVGKMRVLANYCPSSSSFTSSHATNHFAIAMFIFLTFKNVTGKWRVLLFIWAGLISYAQVYAGVHFPTDVLAGAIDGTIIGYLAAIIFNTKIGLPSREYLLTHDDGRNSFIRPNIN